MTRFCVLLSSLLLNALALAGSEINTNDQGLALQGYDPVAYFTTGAPQQGDSQFTAEHNGATYHFASAENRDAFLSDPDKYLPQYGGYCAYGTSLGKKFDGDPLSWKIVDDKLYVNTNAKAHELWLADEQNRIDQADSQWPDIRDKTPAELN